VPAGAKSCLKRPKTVPALAFAAVPAVLTADGEVVCAVDSPRAGISARLCEHFVTYKRTT
jgi:hypothetical protein